MKDEFIGKEVEIVVTKNKSILGMKGKIVDETKNSFKILVNKRNFREFKLVMKKDNLFAIGKKIIVGNKIMKSPEDRIKMKDK